MKYEDDKAYFSQWNNQELELRLLKREFASLKVERDSLRKSYEEDRDRLKDDLAKQREKINKFLREIGRWEGQLDWFKKSVELEGQSTIDTKTLLDFLNSLVLPDIE
jgi:hypothetical protein